MFDRRDFWLAFLCTVCAAIGWLCGHRHTPMLDAAMVARLYDPATAESELLALCERPRRLDHVAISEALATQIVHGDGDCAAIATPLFLIGSHLGPMGVQALRRLLASDDERALAQALQRVRRAPAAAVQELAPELAVVVGTAGRGASVSLAAESARVLCWLGARGCRELLTLSAHDTPQVRDLARAALRREPLGTRWR